MSSLYSVDRSGIHGVGIFAAKHLPAKSFVGLAIDSEKTITRGFGSLINHSYKPNSRLVGRHDGTWWIQTIRPVKSGEEITANYNHTPPFIEKAKAWYR